MSSEDSWRVTAQRAALARSYRRFTIDSVQKRVNRSELTTECLREESVSVPRRNEHSWGIPEVNILRCEQRLAGNIGAGGRLLQDCANMAEVKSSKKE